MKMLSWLVILALANPYWAAASYEDRQEAEYYVAAYAQHYRTASRAATCATCSSGTQSRGPTAAVSRDRHLCGAHRCGTLTEAQRRYLQWSCRAGARAAEPGHFQFLISSPPV